MDVSILEGVLNDFGLDMDRLILDFNNILKVKLSSSDELVEFFCFESHDNFKHLSLLIGMNMLEYIDENSYFLDNGYLTAMLVRIISIFKNKLNIMLEESDDRLVKYVVEPHINSKLTHLSIDNMNDNEELISNYRANYLLLWYHYQDLIGKIIKHILESYTNYLCINRLDKSKFLYVIICGIMEYSFIKVDSELKENIKKEFSSIMGDISYLIDLKGEEYITNIVNSIKELLMLSLDKDITESKFGGEILRNTKEGKFSNIILNVFKSIGHSLFTNCNIIRQYFIVKKLFNSIFVTRDLIEIILKINNEIFENRRCLDIISGKNDGLIISEFTLNDEEFLFTDIEKGDGTFFNIKMKEQTFIRDIHLINDIFTNRNENIKFLGKYSNYCVKNMINIASLVSKNDEIPKTSILEYLTNGISITSDKLTEIYSYLETFKIKRINDTENISDGEKERLKIIKMILDDRQIWIINDCLFNINDSTKKDIISLIMNKVREGNKTILVTDSSNSYDYWI